MHVLPAIVDFKIGLRNPGNAGVKKTRDTPLCLSKSVIKSSFNIMSETINPPMEFAQLVTNVGHVQFVTAEGTLFDHVDNGMPMWSESGDRSVEVQFRFKMPFRGAPSVTAHIVGMDSACNSNQRYWLKVKNVGSNGFNLKFDTWGDTKIARVGVSWQAIGERTIPSKTAADL